MRERRARVRRGDAAAVLSERQSGEELCAQRASPGLHVATTAVSGEAATVDTPAVKGVGGPNTAEGAVSSCCIFDCIFFFYTT